MYILFLYKVAAVQKKLEEKIAAEKAAKIAAEKIVAERLINFPRLDSLSCDAVCLVFSNVSARKKYCGLVTEEGLDGSILAGVKDMDELIDIGMNKMFARRIIEIIKEWQVSGVPKELLVPSPPSSLATAQPSPSFVTTLKSEISGVPNEALVSTAAQPSQPFVVKLKSGVSASGSFSSSDRDMVLVLASLSEGVNSSGKSIVQNGVYCPANTSEELNAKVKMFSAEDIARAKNEYEMMVKLYKHDPSNFVQPHALLRGDSGQITTNTDVDHAQCLSSVCIAMEMGVVSMDKFVMKQKLSVIECFVISEKYLLIVLSACACGVVLMDFKPANIIKVLSSEGADTLKAIDFENSCLEGSNVSGETTAAYSCPELAKYALAIAKGGKPRPLMASQKMDIAALGFAVFELANTNVSFWKCFSEEDMTDLQILEALSILTDEQVSSIIDRTFPSEMHKPLRTWLAHALKINPNERATSNELLHNHSLFGNKERTLDNGGLMEQMLKANIGIEQAISGIQDIQLTIEQVSAKIDVMAISQCDLGLLLRQTAADTIDNHAELKNSLVALSSNLTSGAFSKLANVADSSSSLSVEQIKTIIQDAVKDATPIVVSSTGLNEELKHFISSSFSEFASVSKVSGDSGETKEHLQSMARMLLDLKDDIKKVSSEIADVRADLSEVNSKLGCNNEMLRTLIIGNFNAPSLVVVFPAKPPNGKEKGGGFFKKTKAKALNMFANESVVFFICPVTKKPAKSGPDGKGYRLILPKDWVKKVAPVISISMKILQIAMTTYGIPMPTIPLPSELSPSQFISSILEEIEGELADGIADAVGEEKETMESYLEAYESASDAMDICEGSSLNKRKKEKLALALTQSEVNISYDAIRKLVIKVEGQDDQVGNGWEPKQTGLSKIVSRKDGTVAWVSKEGEELFHETGVDALQ